ncbi:hypothetical protein SAMN02910353_00570 [Ruminococcus sp. YRD2003]|uniref:dockerin type I domain-containing protein n=1 Tax=Ruminococcus sp. YRD2003 TaxID=1452313 RepID=UPI0008AB8736|nr:hypothetical protein SAMN02910353_00570 [Ruminococcus flavefaciens]
MKIKKTLAALSAIAMLASNPSISSGVVYAEEITENPEIVYGDANCDGKTTVADATSILQSIANKDKYKLSPQGKINGDIIDPGQGITGIDALAIKMADAKILSFADFPMTSEQLEKLLHGSEDSEHELVPVSKEQAEVMKDNVLLVVDKDSNELFVYGDMNGDKKLDASDAAALKKRIADKSAYSIIADLDGDNDVDSDDAEMLNGFLNDSTALFPVYAQYDSDADGLNDYVESVVLKTDRLDADTDKDNLTDFEETFVTGTNPTVSDSAVKGTLDCDADIDEDKLTNKEEISLGCNPTNKDSDSDGLDDGYEVNELKTNPTDKDTDHDELSDFEEVKLELDPLKEKSNGVDMDSERIISQVIPADSPIFSDVNTEGNAYELSVTINASGYANNNFSVVESGNAYVLQNGSALGFTPQFYYNEDFKVESITLNFAIKEAYRDNILPYMNYRLYGNTETTYELPEELEGIKRLNVFRYFKNINIALPINTEYDVDTNTVSVTIDTFETDEDRNSLGLGSYSLVDLELWGKMMNEQAVEKTASSDEDSESAETIKSTDTVSINDDNQVLKKTYTIDTEKAQNMDWSLINSNLQTYTERMNASSGTGYSSIASTITRWNGHSYAYFEDRDAFFEKKSIIEECQKKGGYIFTIDSQNEYNQFVKTIDGKKIVMAPGLFHFGKASILNDLPFIMGSYYLPNGDEIVFQKNEENTFGSFYFDGSQIPNYVHFRIRTTAPVGESIPCGYICEWSSDGKITDPTCLRIGGRPYAFLDAPLTVNGTTDSDHDGISDWNEIDHDTIAKLTGSDENTSVSWNIVKKYANDNKLNGKQGMATSKTELVCTGDAELIPTKTNPADDDGDNDGILDNVDPEPDSNYKTKYVYDDKPKYVITDTFEDIKTNDKCEKLAKEADATWKSDRSLFDYFESNYNRANYTCFGGRIAGLKNASLFLDHFLDNNGEDLNYDATQIVKKTDLGQIAYCENVNEIIKLCEDTVDEKCELNLKTPSYVILEGAKFSTNSDSNILVDVFKNKDDRKKITVDWQYSVGDVDAAISVNCKKNGDTYEATVKYYFLDYYDWVPNSKAKGGLVTDGEMYNLHAAGFAKEYLSIGLYENKIEWKKGEKLLYKGDDLIVGKIKSAKK